MWQFLHTERAHATGDFESNVLSRTGRNLRTHEQNEAQTRTLNACATGFAHSLLHESRVRDCSSQFDLFPKFSEYFRQRFVVPCRPGALTRRALGFCGGPQGSAQKVREPTRLLAQRLRIHLLKHRENRCFLRLARQVHHGGQRMKTAMMRSCTNQNRKNKNYDTGKQGSIGSRIGLGDVPGGE